MTKIKLSAEVARLIILTDGTKLIPTADAVAVSDDVLNNWFTQALIADGTILQMGTATTVQEVVVDEPTIAQLPPLKTLKAQADLLGVKYNTRTTATQLAAAIEEAENA